MSTPEDMVRARIVAEQAEAAQAKGARLRAQFIELRAKVDNAIPRILRGLEARGYPDGKLVRINTTKRGRFGRTIPSSEEKAAWPIWEESDSDGSRGCSLLSDGRIYSWGPGGQYGGWTRVEAPSSAIPNDLSDRNVEAITKFWQGTAAGRYGGPRSEGIQGLLQKYGDS